MRNRLFEISAVTAGVAIVAAIYFYQKEGALDDVQSEPRPLTREETRTAPVPVVPAPAVSKPAEAEVRAAEAGLPVLDAVALEEARSEWQNAVITLEAVEAELNVLDTRFDAKEAELSELEAQGMDPDALEEEMLIFLDGIVDEYDTLEARLAEAEFAEADAAARLARMTGSEPEAEEPDAY